MIEIGQRVVRSRVMEKKWHTQLRLLKYRLARARTLAPSFDGQDGQTGCIMQRLPLEHQSRHGRSLSPTTQSIRANNLLLDCSDSDA